MKKRRILYLSLLLMPVLMRAELRMVPAMIVQDTNGNRQVVQLQRTDVTDLVVLQQGQSLQVDVPEAQKSGIRSITFAMVSAGEPSGETAIEKIENRLVQGVKKVVRDGQVFIQLKMPNGEILEYDMKANKFNK